jgi:hypothetical protein
MAIAMKLPFLRAIAFTTLLGLGTSQIGCGYILYPERRGNSGGSIDGGTLVMDCLWLLAGIIPGVIFLIVDFTSGAMYVGGSGSIRISDAGVIDVPLTDAAMAKTLTVRVIDSNGRIVDEATPVQGAHSVELSLASSSRKNLSLQVLEGDTLLQQMRLL